jgi:hypothetical protein
MVDVLWIAVVGATILFIAIGCLIGLMYLLTVPWLLPKDSTFRPVKRRKRRRVFRRRKGAEGEPLSGPVEVPASPPPIEDDREPERLRQAAALAAAIARAESDRSPLFEQDAASEWRLMNRARQLGLKRGGRA